jgi:galactokinase
MNLSKSVTGRVTGSGLGASAVALLKEPLVSAFFAACLARNLSISSIRRGEAEFVPTL